jgi:hypothetical protein
MKKKKILKKYFLPFKENAIPKNRKYFKSLFYKNEN